MTTRELAIRNDMSLTELGQLLVKSGWFTDTREVGQAIIKIMAGSEMGFGPIASMTGINIIQGRVSVSANLQAAAVKRSGRYNYRVIESTDKNCRIDFFENGQPCGSSTFSIDEARKAGTKNLDKYPRNMLFARAMSNGVKWHCPDVFSAPTYTPEEMGAETGEEGEVIDALSGEITPAPVDTRDHAASWDDEPGENGEEIVTNFAPAKTNAKPEAAPVKWAVIKGLSRAAEWQAMCKALSIRFPAYQTVLKGGAPGGQPNYHHILGAAAACGFATVTDENFELVIEAVADRAAQNEPEPV